MPWELGRTGGAITLRMPADDLLLAIAAEVGPLACSAANRRGDITPTTAAEAELQMGESVELVVDGGPRESSMTTIVDCTRDGVHVLREGVVAGDDVQQVAAGDVGWGQQPSAQPGAQPGAVEVDEQPPAARAVDPPAPAHTETDEPPPV